MFSFSAGTRKLDLKNLQCSAEETNQAESKPQLKNFLIDTTETNQEPQKSLHSQHQ